VDVTSAIQSQNVQVAGGQLGGTPAPATQRLTAAITEATLLHTPADFENILLKVKADGSQVRLRGRCARRAWRRKLLHRSQYNGQATAGIGIQLAPGANALATADAVRAKDRAAHTVFPHGVKAVYPYDTTPFVRISITEVVKPCSKASRWCPGDVPVPAYLRATLIPTLAVPVVLLGGVRSDGRFRIHDQYACRCSGLVLAIGLLVDDAIVVVENVERVMSEEGLSPIDATRKAMGQITSALVGVAVVLSAVFVPMAFSPDRLGAIYRQFSP